jgi:hypothetical protein
MKPGGQPITGAPAFPASDANSPPDETATTWAPADSAAAVASRVSSVPPEYDMAKNRVPGPTNRGIRYCFRTVTGTVRSCDPAVASTSPEIPEPPMPATAMLVIPAGSIAPRSTADAVASASPNWPGRLATASTNPSVSGGVTA